LSSRRDADGGESKKGAWWLLSARWAVGEGGGGVRGGVHVEERDRRGRRGAEQGRQSH
jgi:hypothetical protein